jgi:hypothetical protein
LSSSSLQFSGWNPVIIKLTKLLLDIQLSGVKMEPLPGRIMGRKFDKKKTFHQSWPTVISHFNCKSRSWLWTGSNILTGLSDPIACITGTNEKTYFQLILLFLIS